MPRRSWSAAAARTKLAAAGSAASPTVCCTEPPCRSAWSPRPGRHPIAVGSPRSAWRSSTRRTATRRFVPRSARPAGSQLDSCCTAFRPVRRSTTPTSLAAGTSRCSTTLPVLRTLRRWTTQQLGCRRSSSRRRSFSRVMWSSDWQNWGPTMWTCSSVGPVATVRSAGCCLVASQHAWSDAHNSRSWSYHGPRRSPSATED